MFKFAFFFISIAFSLSSYAVNCVIMEDLTQKISKVEKGECFELQGQNNISDNITIEGLLILKTNRDLSLDKNTILIENGGEFLIKGNLLLDGVTIHVKPNSTLTNKGQMTLKNISKISLYKDADFKNQGKFIVQEKSLLSARENSYIDNSSLMYFSSSEFLSNGANILNKSGIDLDNSNFTMFSNSNFENQGRFQSNKLSSVHQGDESLFKNNRKMFIDGSYYMYDQSSLVNDFIIIVDNNANFIVNTTDMLLNNHILDIKGYLNCSNSQLLNVGNLRLQKSGNIKLNRCLVKNEGSIRIDGIVEKDSKTKIENNNIIFNSNNKKSSTL